MGKELNGNFLSRSRLQALKFLRLGQAVLVHPTAVIPDCSRVALGDHCRIDPFTVLSAHGKIEIGSYVHIGSHCSLSGGEAIKIGDFSTLSHNVNLFTSSDDYSGKSMTNPTVPDSFKTVCTRPIHLGRHVIVGAGSIIMPGIEVPEGCAIGALSFVNKPLEAWGVYAGVPVRRISERCKDLLLLEQKLIRARRNTAGHVGAEES